MSACVASSYLANSHVCGVVEESLIHYNRERNRQGIGNELIDGEPGASSDEIECRERIGGPLKFDHRAAWARPLGECKSLEELCLAESGRLHLSQ